MHLPGVMQAPIGPATTTELVVAVSRAGGLGTLAASWTPLGELRAQVGELQRRIDVPFCVNLVLAFDQAERLELLAEARVPMISFSWGADAALIARARAAGVAVAVQVADVPSAAGAVGLGADVLIVQGVEAGGHVQSVTPLAALLRAIRRRVHAPLVAAGGIADRRSAQAALAAGADAVAAGSPYLAAAEADVHPTYRDLVLGASGAETIITTAFDVGWPDASHRTLRNATVDAWIAAGRPPAGRRPGEGERIATRSGQPIVRYSDAQPTRATTGDIAAMALYAGAGIGAVTTPDDAASITGRLLACVPAGRPLPARRG